MTTTRTPRKAPVPAAPSPRRTPATLLRGLAAALLLVLLTVGVPIVMVRIGAYPHGRVDLGGLWDLLLRPGDGGVTLGLTVGVWVCWAIFTVDVVREAVDAIRTRGVIVRPSRGGPFAGVATQLVQAVAVLFLAAPIALSVAPPAVASSGVTASATWSRVDPDPALSGGHAPGGARVTPEKSGVTPGGSGPVASSVARDSGPDLPMVTVKRHDTLWRIAAVHLGDPERWPEIRELNAEQLADGTVVRPGQVLRLPADAVFSTGLPAETVVVEKGDTLSGIAREHGRTGWRAVYRASTGTTQPDGAHLSDPDLIRPGWRLTLPATGAATSSAPAGPAGPASATPRVTPPPAIGGVPMTRPSSPSVTPETPSTATATSSITSTAEETTVRPGWVLPGLTGAGVVLGAGMFLAWRRRRRELSRARRPGHMSAVPEAHLAAVEKTVVIEGPAFAPTVEDMDIALRRMASTRVTASLPIPAVAAVQLSTTSLVVHLAQQCDLVEPWQGSEDRLRWTLTREAADGPDAANVAGVPAPYPLLVTVGADDHGSMWLVNLEQLGVTTITGDAERAADLARYIVAELACNPWSVDAMASCAGIGSEAARMSPTRVRFHESSADAAAEALAEATILWRRSDRLGVDVVRARIGQDGDEVWPGVLLLLNAAGAASPAADELVRLVEGNPGRIGTAVVLVGAPPRGSGVELQVTVEGRLHAPTIGLDLAAVGLTVHEADGCAQLLEVGEDQPDVPMPVDAEATPGWRSFSDEAGALREEVTLPRHTPAQEVTEPVACVLSAPDAEYVQVAATIPEDLEILAPLVPTRIRRRVEDADPTLDDDVAMWFADDCPLPRLTLLGPVRATTRGIPKAVVSRKAHFLALLAYLASRPHGATSDEVADAFNVQKSSARSYIKTLRQWLGINPRTGLDHVPDAPVSPEALERGVPVYQVLDLLVDADLFRRLRVRGEARGAEGIPDLTAALGLVTGMPFDQATGRSWSWMFEGNRLDQHLTCAVVDVAHLVVTDALHRGHLADARFAAEIAIIAAPDEHIAQLDLAAVLVADGHQAAADRLIHETIDDAGDDGIPEDHPGRTQRLLEVGHVAQ
jgi:LysM repeat protein